CPGARRRRGRARRADRRRRGGGAGASHSGRAPGARHSGPGGPPTDRRRDAADRGHRRPLRGTERAVSTDSGLRYGAPWKRARGDEAMKRRGAGTIAIGDVGSRVRLQAWVQRRRDLGGLLFLDLRDRSGVVQVVIRPGTSPEAAQVLDAVRPEWVVEI